MIIVVAYRADEHLDSCLGTLQGGARVIVVDNDASSATARVCAAHGANYVAAEANLGFAGGVNRGLSHGWDGQQDVLLLNPDARLTLGGLEGLETALHTNPKIAAVAPALEGLDGSPQRGAWPLPSPKQVWADAFAAGSLLERMPFFLVGAVLLLNGQALTELGGLDERYFLYSEEADWQMRARRAGWGLTLVESVLVPHEGSASSSDPIARLRLFHASTEVFGRRWYGPAGWQLMRAGAVIGALRRNITGGAQGRANARATLKLFLQGPVRSARHAGQLP